MEEQKAIGIDFSIASKEAIEVLISEVGDPGIYEEILQANGHRPEIIRLIIENPDTPEDMREKAAKLLQMPVKAFGAIAKREQMTEEMKAQTLLQKIQQLSMSEKRMLAMKGGREARSILIKDTNKQIMLAVLDNPKITDSEIEIIAHSRSIPDDALRAITKNRDWMKSYGIMLAVACNPKTPVGVAVPLLMGLKTKDIVSLEKNKNVSEALRSAAKKIVQARKPH